MESTLVRHPPMLPETSSLAFRRYEQAVNVCSCIPHPLAQIRIGALHLLTGVVQVAVATRYVQHGLWKAIQIQGERDRNWTLSEEDRGRYREYIAMASTGGFHCIDGIENVMRGLFGYRVGTMTYDVWRQFPKGVKLIPAILGGGTLALFNIYCPKKPFHQIVSDRFRPEEISQHITKYESRWQSLWSKTKPSQETPSKVLEPEKKDLPEPPIASQGDERDLLHNQLRCSGS